MKTIKINKKLENKIIAFCDDELNYHINESECAEQYHDEIMAQIELLMLLGCLNMANKYIKQYEDQIK